MSTAEQSTCGKGLAENWVLAAKLGQVIAAMDENLEVHMEALDLTDQNSRQEYNAYERLAKEYRQIAAQLHATANQTAGYRDLPRELLSLFEETAEHDDKLLEAMSIHNR